MKNLVVITCLLCLASGCRPSNQALTRYEPQYDEPISYDPSIVDVDTAQETPWIETTQPASSDPMPVGDVYGSSSDVQISGGTSGMQIADSRTAGAGGARTHQVQAKDTLYGLARKYYNDPSQWKTIFQANRDRISDPNKIAVGMVLVIP